MAKKKGAYNRMITGIITKAILVGDHKVVRLGTSTVIGEERYSVVAFARNITGLTDVNNIGPGNVKPSIIVTLVNANDETNIEHYVVNDDAIDCTIFKDVPVETEDKEVKMSVE